MRAPKGMKGGGLGKLPKGAKPIASVSIFKAPKGMKPPRPSMRPSGRKR